MYVQSKLNSCNFPDSCQIYLFMPKFWMKKGGQRNALSHEESNPWTPFIPILGQGNFGMLFVNSQCSVNRDFISMNNLSNLSRHYQLSYHYYTLQRFYLGFEILVLENGFSLYWIALYCLVHTQDMVFRFRLIFYSVSYTPSFIHLFHQQKKQTKNISWYDHQLMVLSIPLPLVNSQI